ncbi:MAG: helix-turn-helix domain-containing protein [Saprospiraceae bacterium]|nr:helix-turn-helix domain-containing protein [Saprospiraceae bacterium]
MQNNFHIRKLHNRLCNRYRHKTAGDIIRDRVYLEAQRLLQHTQMSISEISEQLGFDSASYFTTFFKKKFTLTPEEFRSKNL